MSDSKQVASSSGKAKLSSGPSLSDTSHIAESTTSSDPAYDLEETWPKEIKIPESRATVEWQTGRQEHLWFNLVWVPRSSKAFFKLRASIQTNVPETKGKKTSVYLFIYPERVRRLSVENHIETGHSADSLVLRWELAKQPALVLPPTDGEPGNDRSRSTLAAMYAIAAETIFTIHITVKGKRQSMRRMRELCQCASNSGLLSLAGQDTASLYRGRGGRVVEGSTLVAAPSYASAQLVPPAYQEPLDEGKALGSGSPLAGRASLAKKRRREDSTPEGDEPLRAMINAIIDARLHAQMSKVVQMIQEAEERITQKVIKELDQHINIAVEDHVVNAVDDRIHEVVTKRVQEEMEDVESTIMQNITDAPLEASISFPGRPWY